MDVWQKLQLMLLFHPLVMMVWCAILRVGVLGWLVALVGGLGAAAFPDHSPLYQFAWALWALGMVAIVVRLARMRNSGLIPPRRALAAAAFNMVAMLLFGAAIWIDLLFMKARAR